MDLQIVFYFIFLIISYELISKFLKKRRDKINFYKVSPSKYFLCANSDRLKKYIVDMVAFKKEDTLEEFIRNSAIKINNKEIVFLSSVLVEHGDIYECMAREGFYNKNIVYNFGFFTEGFVTSRGRFVDRREAMEIAIAQNQLGKKDITLYTKGSWLYSSDIEILP